MKTFISGGFLFLIFNIYQVEACCREGGLWSEWTGNEVSDCPETCGAFGTYKRTRICLSEDNECPCIGEDEEEAVCDRTPCNYPRMLTCATGFSLGLYNQKPACIKPNEVAPVAVVAPSLCSECCPDNGIWSEWVGQGICSATCGSCGVLTRTRKCLSESYNCPCVGPTEDKFPCNSKACVNTTQICCDGFGLQYSEKSGVYECLAVTPVIEKQIKVSGCCDPEGLGLWNSWSEWSLCSASCGMCGIRVRSRTCASQMHGCACVGENKEQKLCGSSQCQSGDTCCTPATAAFGFDGSKICTLKPEALPIPTTTPTSITTKAIIGSWSAWVEVAGATCSDTCGSCGKIAAKRTCLPAGATCSGSSSGTIICATQVCAFPRPTCCSGFKKSFNEIVRAFICVLDNVQTN